MKTTASKLIVAYSRGFVQFLGPQKATLTRYYEETALLITLFANHPDWIRRLRFLNQQTRDKRLIDIFVPPFALGWAKLFGLLLHDGNWLLLLELLGTIKVLLARKLAIALGKVYSVVRLTSTQMALLTTALTKRFQTPVELQNYLDPTLIGGVVVEIANQVFDNSLKTRLQSLQLALQED